MGGFIQRVDRAEDRTRARFHQIDLGQIPAGIAQGDLREGAVAGRNLEALALQTHRAVRAPLPPPDFDAEGTGQLGDGRAFPGDTVTLQIAGQRGSADLAMAGTMILPLYPGLRRPVQGTQGQPLFALQHGQQATFDLAPEALLLPILVFMWSAT